MSSRVLFAMCNAVFLSLPVCSVKAAESHELSVINIRNQIDAARGRVWILANQDVAVYDPAAKDKLRHVRLPGRFYAVEPYGCLPDFTLGPVGEAIIPSNVMPVLWRIDRDLRYAHKTGQRLSRARNCDAGGGT